MLGISHAEYEERLKIFGRVRQSHLRKPRELWKSDTGTKVTEAKLFTYKGDSEEAYCSITGER